ncbi:MAG TPA: hypothetical protein VF278_06340 [Pirellulales bacterium]
MAAIYLNESDVTRLLDVRLAIAVMEEMFRRLAASGLRASRCLRALAWPLRTWPWAANCSISPGGKMLAASCR